MLLQKSCHDMDILQWLIGKKCKKVQSFGTLSYFKEENAPKDAPDYCIQGCPKADTCPYNAVRLYLDDKEMTGFEQPQPEKQIPLMKWWKQHFVQHNMESVYSNVITML